MDYEFGVMQGRLLPKYKGQFQAHPKNYWQKEFKIASELKFNSIEFILDFEDYKENPLLNKNGIIEISKYMKKENVFVKSVCADFYMNSQIYKDDEQSFSLNFKVMELLIKNCSFLGVTDIVLPLVDSSSIINSNQKLNSTILFLERTKSLLNKYKINICLETDLPPKEFLKLILKLNSPYFKINYDTGNSVYMGYDFKEELDAYAKYVTNIHIKDRIYKGPSVILGTGSCQFEEFFKYLKKIKYSGIIILQAYRSDDGIRSIKPQLQYLRKVIESIF